MTASLNSESGKMFSSFERFLVCFEEEDSQIAVASTGLASTKTHVEIPCREVLGAGRG